MLPPCLTGCVHVASRDTPEFRDQSDISPAGNLDRPNRRVFAFVFVFNASSSLEP